MNFEFSQDLKDLASALCSAKKMFHTPKKSGHNPHYNSAFSTFNDIKDATALSLADNGLTVSHFPISEDERVGIKTILLHTSGQFISSSFSIKLNRNSEQDVGKIITYFKRYSLGAILGIEGEIDTDGDLVTGETIYVGTEEQVKILKTMFQKHGVDKVEVKQKISDIFFKRRSTFSEIEKTMKSEIEKLSRG